MIREDLIEAIIVEKYGRAVLGALIGSTLVSDGISRGVTGKSLWHHAKKMPSIYRRRKVIRRKLRAKKYA